MQFKIFSWRFYLESNYLFIPKIDVVFHSLFRSGNESITKALISDIIGCNIQSINLDTDRHLLTKHPEDKLGILDVKAVLDDGILCNIEVQLVNNHNTESRFLYYWSRLFSSQLVKGNNYSKLKKTICIAILDYELDRNLTSTDFHTKWNILNTKNGRTILTNLFELHILEIPKALKHQNLNDPIVQWMWFLSNPNQMEVLDVMKKNLKIEEAMELLEQISQDKELQRRIELRQKAILDENSAKTSNIQYGMKKGLEQGLEQGKTKIAKNMLAKDMDVSIISEVTGLSIEEINNLKTKS